MPTLNIKYRTFDGFERALAEQTRHFSALHPEVGFALSHAGPEELYAEMVQGGGAQGGTYDVMLALTDWLPDLMRRGGLLRLDAYLAADPPADWPHGWAESVLGLQRDAQGHVYALPYHDGPEIFHYRTDLFADPQEQARYERRFGRRLRVPETWSEFLDVARFFTRPGDGLYGTVVAGLNDGHNTVYDFLIHLWSRGGRLLDERLRPAFHGPTGVEALQFYVDLVTKHGVCPPRTLEYDSVAAGVAYAAGEGATMLNWSGFMAVAQLPPSAIINKTRCAPIPRGDGPQGRHASLNVYWVLGVCAGSRQPDLAYQFLKETASPAMDKVTSLAGGTGVRRSTWNDPEIRAQFQYYEVIEEVHRGADTLPALPEYPAINEVLNRMSWNAVQGRASVERALRDAAEECERILAHSAT
ncbi:MAG TPA: extracellular solute-binding protein [Roseiflexaceae bacterium]|nr:extracellular solute-binding protein [Roseiflexaceae bacterium]